MDDLISRKAAIDAYILHTMDYLVGEKPRRAFTEVLRELPPAQPEVLAHGEGELSAQTEPLSDAYMKAVWTWLSNYQIKAAELKGRYTPYEVLSWVANDWRKEHERSNQQTGGN